MDYAEAAAAVLTSEGHDGKTYELAGDNAFTLSDLAAEISRQAGRDIPYRDLDETEYAAALASFGLPENAARAYASFGVAAALARCSIMAANSRKSSAVRLRRLRSPWQRLSPFRSEPAHKRTSHVSWRKSCP